MLAPIDKIERGGNDILQIEITRKCDLFNCSNCTRLLPFRKDNLEMSLEVFAEAVRSLDGWPGVVALFGGNPCTHSHFADICQILAKHVPPEKRGLWTNHLRGHGSLCRQVFAHGRLNLNAHGNAEAYAEMNRWFPGRVIPGTDTKPSWHAAILTSWRDLGLSEAEWVQAREACDINQRWSGIIQQRDSRAVAYFCEVAGSLDGATGERNGLPVYPGWWRERIPAFASQIRNCCDGGCGVPLRFKGHLDQAGVYDVTRSWLPVAGEPRGDIEIKVHESRNEVCRETTDYVRLRT
jgi:hypothetical protein